MAKKKRSALARKRDLASRIVSEQLEQIDDALGQVEKLLEGYQPIIDKKNRLHSARRALLGGTRSTGAGGTSVRQEDVVADLQKHPGSTAAEIAKRVGGNRAQITGHLSRGKNERFIGPSNDNRYWLREPKKGIKTLEDVDQLQEDE